MSVAVIDLSNYRDRTGTRVPEGDYLVAVEEIEVGESRKGDTMWTVYLRVLGGDFDGSTLIDRMTLTDRAMFRAVGFLGGMGIKIQRKKMTVDLGKLVGRKVSVQVSDGEPYNGTVRSEVRNYVRVAGSSSSSSDLDDLDSVDQPRLPVAEETEVSQTSSNVELDLDNLEI